MLKIFLTNPIILSVIVTYLICHVIKFVDMSIEQRKFAFEALVMTGGMPSSHSSFVSTLAISVGLVEGWTSSVFLVSLSFAIIVIRDAFGVRRTVDKLIVHVNSIIKKKKLGLLDIKGIAGHTPVQVMVGVIIGVVVAIVTHKLV